MTKHHSAIKNVRNLEYLKKVNDTKLNKNDEIDDKVSKRKDLNVITENKFLSSIKENNVLGASQKVEEENKSLMYQSNKKQNEKGSSITSPQEMQNNSHNEKYHSSKKDTKKNLL